jgi:beta-galactosidase
MEIIDTIIIVILLAVILKELRSMSTQLSSNFIALQQQVQNTDGVIASAVAAFQGLEAELAAAIAANANGDTNALPNLQTALAAATAGLSAAIAAVPAPTGATPVITTQPQGTSAVAGTAASFSVVATGAAPLAFQWSKDGNPIAGATGNTYNTPATSATDNGASFTVKVSNSLGSATSNPAVLTVTGGVAPGQPGVAPSITTQPASQNAAIGSTASLSVLAAGDAPLSYQWNLNGAAVAGATSSTYVTPTLAATDNGDSYTVTVTNATGSVTSNPAVLTVA